MLFNVSTEVLKTYKDMVCPVKRENEECCGRWKMIETHFQVALTRFAVSVGD